MRDSSFARLPAAPGRRVSRFMALMGLTGLIGCLPRTTGPVPLVEDVASLRHAVDALLAAPETRHARWGVLIVDPDRGDTLYSHDAGKLFVPASNQKIITAAVALQHLGPEFRYRTPLLATGPVIDGELVGDLVVVGRGDPSMSDHMAGDAMLPLAAAADALRARGITRIRGSVRAQGNAFPDATLGFGWAWDDLDFAYSAPVDELLFNEGFSVVHVRGADQPGDPPVVRSAPARSFPALRLDATTIAPAPPDTVTRVTVVKDTLRGDVVVGGVVLAGDSVSRAISHRDPAQAFVRALAEALRDQGIAIVDSAMAADADSVMADTLYVIESPPLTQILSFFMKPSQNQIGEMLLKTVALERTDTGTARVGRRIMTDQLLEWGADSTGFAVFDGSGLSRRNLVSPETIIRVLDAMRRGPYFEGFHDAFPVAGVDGTLRLRMRETRAEGNVRGKTGTLGSVRSLSGYVTTADGQQLLFSVLANNFLVGTDQISRVQDSIAVRLARLRGRAPVRGAPSVVRPGRSTAETPP